MIPATPTFAPIWIARLKTAAASTPRMWETMDELVLTSEMDSRLSGNDALESRQQEPDITAETSG
jgi:hypothetical protein